jgi:glycosyltransferase involved in cell wall biosynthesis
MSRRRVLVVHDTLAGWGAERTLARFGEFVDRDAFEVSFLLTTAKPSASITVASGGNTFFLGAPRLRVNKYTEPINFVLKFVYAIPWFLRHRGKFDYLIAANPEESAICFFGKKVLGLKYKLLVYNQIALDLAPANLFMNLVLRAFIAINKRADGVLCVSRALCDHLATSHRVRNAMFVLPGCVDRRQIDVQSREAVDEAWLLRDERKTIIFVGRLSNRQKRVDVLLKAAALLRKNLSFKVIVVGEGEDGEFLRQLTNQLGLEDQVYFLGYKRNPYKYYALSDVLVLTSDIEGFGNVLIEAMACGLPVIATDCPTGPAEILDSGRWGVLVPPGDHELLADKIARVLLDDELRRDLSRKSLIRASEFDGIKVFEKFTRICEDLDKRESAPGLA